MDLTGLLAGGRQELRRGTVVLACILLLREAGYGYALLDQLRDLGFTVDANTLYPLLRRLEAQGLVSRARRDGDERVLDIGLTAAGRALRRQALQVPEQVMARTGMSVAEVAALRNALQDFAGAASHAEPARAER